MAANDVVFLLNSFEQWQHVAELDVDDSVAYRLFVYEQVLKEYGLSYEELSHGDVDRPDDGGIDGFFLFLNGVPVAEDTDIGIVAREPVLDLFLIQVKEGQTFEERPLDAVLSTALRLFDFGRNIDDAGLLNHDLRSAASRFRDAYLVLSARHAKVAVHYCYATRGDSQSLNDKVRAKGEQLTREIEKRLPGGEVDVAFLGARELLVLARQRNPFTLQLRYRGQMITSEPSSLVLLVNLVDYYHFIADEQQHLRKSIFEDNVRDYRGEVEVNAGIRQTLSNTIDALDFWWLNNGVTVVTNRMTLDAQSITMDEPQVVNGLQTSYEIFNHFSGAADDAEPKEDRRILVRVIETSDSSARDRIIKATNFQSAMPSASLRATDPTQREIEQFFGGRGWYYDRRKNYYKNEGKPADHIVSMQFLAQALLAIVFREPDSARARPTTAFKSEKDYKRLFDYALSPQTYLLCARIARRVESVVRKLCSERERGSNFRFHVCTLLAIQHTGRTDYEPEDLSSWQDVDVNDEQVAKRLNEVQEMADTFCLAHPEFSLDSAAKSREFVAFMLQKAYPATIDS